MMEETLKLILEKINSMDSKINSIQSEVTETKVEVQSVKSIQLRMEQTMTEKFGALFDAREVSKDTDARIEAKIDKIQNELSNVEKVTIKNAADIISLQDYRKEN